MPWRYLVSNVWASVGQAIRSQIFKSVVTMLLVAGLATASFHWGMWVERGRPRPAPSITVDYQEPVVTERSEDMSPSTVKAGTTKPGSKARVPTTQKPTAMQKASSSGKPGASGAAKPTTEAGKAGSAKPSSTAAIMARPVTGQTLVCNEWVYSPSFGDWRFHSGLDLGAEKGTPVKAVLDGTVISIKDDPAYGRTVQIDHGGGITAVYAGLEDVPVATGERVARNQVIGRIGEPGILEADMGPHLHFEVRRNGSPENPLSYLPR